VQGKSRGGKGRPRLGGMDHLHGEQLSRRLHRVGVTLLPHLRLREDFNVSNGNKQQLNPN
jgi:hypothetical protein